MRAIYLEKFYLAIPLKKVCQHGLSWCGTILNEIFIAKSFLKANIYFCICQRKNIYLFINPNLICFCFNKTGPTYLNSQPNPTVTVVANYNKRCARKLKTTYMCNPMS